MEKSTNDLISEFLATKGATKIPEGARATTDAQMKRAIGYTPDREYKWDVQAQGEDGGHFCSAVLAKSKREAEEVFRESYPESFVISVEPYGDREMRIYQATLAAY